MAAGLKIERLIGRRARSRVVAIGLDGGVKWVFKDGAGRTMRD
jgi:hypothetical protein